MLSTEVRFSQLIDRIDANFYTTQIKTLEELKTSRISERSTMKELCIFPRTKTPGRYDYTEKGVPVIKLKNITDYFIDLNDTSFIPDRLYPNYIQPKEEDILITATGEGTIGRVGIFKNSIKCIVTAEVMIARVKKEKINPCFLFCYLRSRHGKPLIIRFVRGSTGQTHLYSKDVKFISVPIPPKSFQDKIEKIVKEAYEKRNSADQKYEQAKQLLEKELGLDKLKLKEEKTFEAKFSNVKQTMRFDSEYYKPKYEEIVKFLKDYGARKLKEVVKISNRKIDPSKEPTKKFKYVELANINPSTGEIEGVEELFGYQAPSRARMFIEKGDVLIASLSGSLDNVGLVTDDLDKQVASTGFFVVNSESFHSEVLFLLFKTELTKAQLEQKTAGAIMTAVPKSTFGDLLLPILPKSKQEKIAVLVRESFNLREESKELLDKAKLEVEKMIEGR
jgi:restriction endonuclease S subunit